MKKKLSGFLPQFGQRCLKKQEINFVKKIKRAKADSVVVTPSRRSQPRRPRSDAAVQAQRRIANEAKGEVNIA